MYSAVPTSDAGAEWNLSCCTRSQDLSEDIPNQHQSQTDLCFYLGGWGSRIRLDKADQVTDLLYSQDPSKSSAGSTLACPKPVTLSRGLCRASSSSKSMFCSFMSLDAISCSSRTSCRQAPSGCCWIDGKLRNMFAQVANEGRLQPRIGPGAFRGVYQDHTATPQGRMAHSRSCCDGWGQRIRHPWAGDGSREVGPTFLCK
jgi:hypothetical protein